MNTVSKCATRLLNCLREGLVGISASVLLPRGPLSESTSHRESAVATICGSPHLRPCPEVEHHPAMALAPEAILDSHWGEADSTP